MSRAGPLGWRLSRRVEAERRVGGLGQSDARAHADRARRLAIGAEPERAGGAQIEPVERAVDPQGSGQPSGTAREIRPAHMRARRRHQMRALHRLECAEQHGRTNAVRLGRDVEHPGHAVAEIDVGRAARAEQRAVAGGHAAIGVHRGVAGRIGLRLHDAPGDTALRGFAHQDRAEQEPGERDSVRRQVGAGEGAGAGRGGVRDHLAGMRDLPTLYHLAEADNWPRIERDGLLSASRLMDRAGLDGAARAAMERAQRPARTVLPDGCVLRDQKPMAPDALACALVGMSPAEWYAALNACVFFWPAPERLRRQARALSATMQMVLIFDGAALLAAHGPRAFVTAINTGNARRRPALRGRSSFVPYEAWRREGWSREAAGLGTRARLPSHPVAELVVADAVPDAMTYLLDARPL